MPTISVVAGKGCADTDGEIPHRRAPAALRSVERSTNVQAQENYDNATRLDSMRQRAAAGAGTGHVAKPTRGNQR